MSTTQKSIVGGMTVLSLSGLICKIVGALYRIPLAWLIGEEGLCTYQLVFPTYNMLLTISSAGLPVAISRMVSYSITKGNPRGAKHIFRLALYMLSAFGCIGMILMMVASPWLAQRSGDLATQPGFVAIAPALLLVCTMSALRGFMQGQQNMVPTAISQLIEQVGKVFIALPLAYFGMKVSVAYAAAGVLLGTSIAEGVALLYMYIVYVRDGRDYNRLPQDENAENTSAGSLIRQLIQMAIPITIGACVVPISGFIDSGILLNRLLDAGIEYNQAKALYGRYSGYVLTLINVPTALATSICMSLVPNISAAMARKDGDGMRRQSMLGLRLGFVLGLPCTVGMCLLAPQLLSLIYHFSTAEALQSTANMLRLSGITIVLFTTVQSSCGILQGLKKERIPMYTLVIGVIVKIILNYTLIGNRQFNIYGASIASITCYTISMVPNLYYVFKLTKAKPEWNSILLRPLAASVLMGVVLFACTKLFPSGRLWTVVEVFAGVSSYIVFCLLTGAITKQEMKPILRKLKLAK